LEHKEERGIEIDIPITELAGDFSSDEIQSCASTIQRFVTITLNGTLPVSKELVNKSFQGYSRPLVSHILAPMILGLKQAPQSQVNKRIIEILGQLEELLA
jgi:hypothetical protein